MSRSTSITHAISRLVAMAWIAALFAPAVLFGQSTAEALRQSVSKEYARHNWLAYFSNEFDSTVVDWGYGEVRIDFPYDTQFVFLELTRREFFSRGECCSERGVGTRGPNHSLGERARTKHFRYKPGSSLVFVRLVNAKSSGTGTKPDYSSDEFRSWRDYFCVTRKTEYTDTVNVALELADAATGERLLLLDSLSMYVPANGVVLKRFGTNPETSVRRIQLPENFAERDVYIRPVPYRYGQSPYGLLLKKLQHPINQAHLYFDEHTLPLSNLPRHVDVSDWYSTGKSGADTVDESAVNDCVEFYLRSFEKDSCIHPVFADLEFSPEQQMVVRQVLAGIPALRYSFTCYERARADTAWILSTLLPEPNTKEGMVGAKAPTANFSLRSAGGAVYATLTGTKSSRNRFVAYDVTGAEIFRGTFPSAPFENIEIPLPESVKGNVFVRCVIADGTEASALVARVF